jgi:hypothetical protein
MAPPLSKLQTEILQRLYYQENYIFGRDKIHMFFNQNFPDAKISRRQVADWLKKQEINQLHQPHQQSRDIKSTVLSAPNKQVGIDLVDMQNFELNGYKYILTGVDLFSRYMVVVPLKNKEDVTVLNGFKTMLKEIPNVKSIRSDNGSEFVADMFQKYLKDKNIHQVFSKSSNPQSNGGIERFNQTLKRLIHKSIELNNKFDWVANLNKLVNNLNDTIIARINKTPNEMQNETGDDAKVTEDLDKKIKKNTAEQKFKVKDKVRIFQPSDKMKSRNWSEDVYEIETVFKPKTEYGVFEYKLKEFDNRFLTEDLLKISEVQNKIEKLELYEISKIVRPSVLNNQPHFVVKWKGFRKKSDDTIEPQEALLKDVPKMMNAFIKKHEVKFRTVKGVLKFNWNEKGIKE